MQGKSDDDLVALGRQGSTEALEEIYRRHSGSLLNYASRLLGDRVLGEDVVQNAFIYFFQHLDRYDPRGKLGAYLFRIGHSIAMDEKSADRRRRSVAQTKSREPLFTPPPDEGASAEEAAAQEARVKDALFALPGHLREVVVLRLYEGLDYAKVGEITGVSEATARSRMRYALESLRDTLGAEFRRPSGNIEDFTAQDR